MMEDEGGNKLEKNHIPIRIQSFHDLDDRLLCFLLLWHPTFAKLAAFY